MRQAWSSTDGAKARSTGSLEVFRLRRYILRGERFVIVVSLFWSVGGHERRLEWVWIVSIMLLGVGRVRLRIVLMRSSLASAMVRRSKGIVVREIVWAAVRLTLWTCMIQVPLGRDDRLVR